VVASFLTELRKVLSHDRLERYRTNGGTDIDMIATYYWNIEICETLYQTLGALEMALRNTMSDALSQHFNRSDWYDQPHFLQKREATTVFTTKFDLENEGKQIVPGRVIAGQTFGFWTSLLSGGYSVWSTNNHALVKVAFPHAPIQQQYRKRVHERMNAIRLFRNRVFHYESILDGVVLQNGARISLLQTHSEIVEAIGWINPTFCASVRTFDRFIPVHAGTATAVEMKIKQHLNIP
jgi:hypothetical protein